MTGQPEQTHVETIRRALEFAADLHGAARELAIPALASLHALQEQQELREALDAYDAAKDQA